MAQCIQVRVIDNGCGFDAQSQHRKGLAAMRERTAAFGAQLHIPSQSGHTEVAIGLPKRAEN
jgi:signal transduction histidine kinase